MTSPEEYRNLFGLEDKIALVPGGAGGIGRAVSEGLAAFGARVVVCQRSKDRAQEVAGEIEKAGGKAEGGSLDITDSAQVRAFVKDIGSRYGKVDILVNCVGIHQEAPAIDYEEEVWDRIFATNLKAAFFLSQAVARVQIPKGGGKQIHITSVRSHLGLKRGYISYCSSKGGMNLMIKQLATEWAKHRINVNGIAPTFIRTENVRKYLEDPAFYNPLVERIPLGRVGEPIDIAAMAIYLASPAADFITGQVIFADGGLTACQ
jgi:NAD(P)-dependent dehydrogenase (short-subunit alcohol dehydrogenase family)